MASPTSVAQALQLQRSKADRVEQVAGGIYESVIFLTCTGVGEAFQQIDFPVRYTEKPCFTSGFEMAPSQRLQQGNYPTCIPGIYVWKYGKNADKGISYYDGCTVFIVTSGLDNLVLDVHLRFDGKAIQNPAGQ